MSASIHARLAIAVVIALLTGGRAIAAALELRVEAPPSLAAAAGRIRAIATEPLALSLSRAGLDLPQAVDIRLIPEDDPRARQTPPWIVGQAFGDRAVWIFPHRVTTYPYDSIESVVRHEVVHLALSSRAGGQPLPRWFHEGVAVSVENGWGLGASVRLLLAAADQSTIAGVDRLFNSGNRSQTTEAYLLTAALVDDVRDRHGAAVPGAIARRVAGGASFDRAFVLETGETPDDAAARAWRAYRQWSMWLPVVTDPSALWSFILLLAVVAFVARLYQRRHRRWEEGEDAIDD